MTGAAVATSNSARPLRLTHNMVRPAVIFSAFALLPLIAWLGAEKYLLDVGARIMVFAIAAVALDLLVGYGGLISFGHAAFIGLGAYAVGILSAHGIAEGLIALPVAIAVSALFAWLTGIVCLRTKGAYFIMITLAFGQMVYFIATSLAPYGGDDGLTIAARNTIAGLPLLTSDRAFYYFTFVCLLATYVLCRRLVASRFGRVLRGAKENATRTATIGFNVRQFQLVAYVIAGALGGFSGFLLANLTEFVGPDLYVVAAIRRVAGHGDPRRSRIVGRRDYRQRRLSGRRRMAVRRD